MSNATGIDPSRIGCSTITFRLLPISAAVARIAACGLKCIDLGMITRFCAHLDPFAGPAELGRVSNVIVDAGLRVSTCNSWSLSHLNDLEDDRELAHLRATMAMAAGLGARVITVQPGRAVPDEAWAADSTIVAGRLNQLGAEAQQLGLAVAVEAPHMGTLAPDFDRACRFIELLDRDVVGVALDTSHVLNGHASVGEALAAYGERVRHVQLRDWRAGDIHVTPGDGEVDFAALFRGLVARGYQGDFNLELEYPERDTDGHERELHRGLAHVLSAAVGS